MDMQKILTQIIDVLGEIEYLLKSNNVPGPYSRTRAYEFRKLLGNCRVFQYRDVLKSYYVIDVSTVYGQRLYDDLWSKRLILNRLRKELEKI
ncbi:hypothetical protein [Microviridae sp.]|nr:hypothetical protein [Microviridae sp.]